MPSNQKLPNAPLAEVVFELRWNLPKSDIPAPFREDPGFGVFADRFSSVAKSYGFPVTKNLSSGAPPLPYSIFRRFYPTDDVGFPLLQIGPGIFAANESTNYEWKKYKAFLLKWIKRVFKTYPAKGTLALDISALELRYVDVFDSKLVDQSSGFSDFLRHISTYEVNAPNFLLDKKTFENSAAARIVYEFPVRKMKGTRFIFDVGTAVRGKEQVIRLETKAHVRTDSTSFPRGPVARLKAVADWLESAHDLTSPFFKSFVRPEVMEKFRQAGEK